MRQFAATGIEVSRPRVYARSSGEQLFCMRQPLGLGLRLLDKIMLFMYCAMGLEMYNDSVLGAGGMMEKVQSATISETRVPDLDNATSCSTGLSDAGSIASLVSLVGLIPIIWAAIVLIRERRRAGKANWLRKLKTNRWHVVRPTYQSKMARAEDVMACHEVALKLMSLGHQIRVVDDQRAIDEPSNTVLICGPRSNKKSREVAAEAQLPIRIDTTCTPNVIRDERTGQVYRSPLDDGRNADIAILARVSSPSGNPCFLVWGLHGAGTVGAAKAFCDNNLLHEIYASTSGSNFVSVVYVTWDSFEVMGTPSWLVPPRKI